MQTLTEVRAEVLARCSRLGIEDVEPPTATGQVLAADVVAAFDVPGFPSSAMDGFAVRSADVGGATEAVPVVLEVTDTVMAGRASDRSVGQRQAIRIMTGAPVPDGADAVVPVESTRHSRGERGVDETVAVLAPVQSGQHLRGAGDDVRAGVTVVTAGTVVTPPLVGVLVSVAGPTVSVVRRPRVGVLSTGDELVAATRGLGVGQIRDSNRPMLISAVQAAGGRAVDLGWVRDDVDAVASALRSAATRCDLILTSGGVSMGELDVIKMVLDRMDEPRWFQIAMRPAKPFAMATVDGVPLLGLPGNPVSSLVSFEMLARPAIRQMAGHPVLDRPRITARVAGSMTRRPDGKVHLVRVRLARGADQVIEAAPVAAQGSHQLVATASAHGLAIVPDGVGVASGGAVEVIVLDAEAALGLPAA